MSSSRCCEFCGKSHVIQKQEIRYGNTLYQHNQITEERFDTFNFSVGKETVYGYQHTADLQLRSPHQEEYVEPETCTTATQYSTSHMEITESNASMYNSWQDAERRLVTDISRDPNTRLPNFQSRRRKRRTVKCKCSPESPKNPTPRNTPPEPAINSIECICPPICQTVTTLREPKRTRKFDWSQLGLQAPVPAVCGCYVRKSEAMTNLRNWNYSKRDPFMTKIICKCKPPKPRRQTIEYLPEKPPQPKPVKRPTKIKEPNNVIPELPIQAVEVVKIERKLKQKQPKPIKKQPNTDETKPIKKPADTKKVNGKTKEQPKPEPVPPPKKVSFGFGGVLLKERPSLAPITICDCCCPRKCLPPCCYYSKCDVCPYYSYCFL